MVVELLYIDDCPNAEALLPLLRRLMDDAGVKESVTQQRITSGREAVAKRFLGSPTVRVDGVDVDPDAPGRADYGMQCRVYRTPSGLRGTPAKSHIRQALTVSRSVHDEP